MKVIFEVDSEKEPLLLLQIRSAAALWRTVRELDVDLRRVAKYGDSPERLYAEHWRTKMRDSLLDGCVVIDADPVPGGE